MFLHKLMKILMLIQIGRRVLLSITILSIFSGCAWLLDRLEYDHIYDVYIKNDSPYKLELLYGSDEIGSFFINPYDSSDFYGSFGVEEEEDPIRDRFFDGGNRGNSERVQVLINDSVVVDWIGPPREMDLDIHHFFNYNSWEVLLEEGAREGLLRFTISPADLNRTR
jgi:hypothetical protein